MITVLTAIARERQRDIILMCYYLHYIPVSLYAVCKDVIELVSSPDPVVMGTIKQTSSSHDKSHDTHMTQLDLMSL